MNLLLAPRSEESDPMMGRLVRKAMFLVDPELQSVRAVRFNNLLIQESFRRASFFSNFDPFM